MNVWTVSFSEQDFPEDVCFRYVSSSAYSQAGSDFAIYSSVGRTTSNGTWIGIALSGGSRAPGR